MHAGRSHNHKVSSIRQGSVKKWNRRLHAPNSVDKALGLAYTEDESMKCPAAPEFGEGDGVHAFHGASVTKGRSA